MSKQPPIPWYVRRLVVAIAIAERGTVELYSGEIRNCNPGDIMGPDGRLMVYEDNQSGWGALINMVLGWFSGTSKLYHPKMTLVEVASVYTGGDHFEQWALIVSGFMGVHLTTTLEEIAQYDQDASKNA
jgi:hypothetical protein